MSATFASILPRLATVLETIALDGTSGRAVRVPKEYPERLSGADLPAFINRMQINRTGSDQREFRNYTINITATLYLSEVGTQLAIINQYDIYSYVDKLDDLFVTKSHLEDSNNQGLTGVSGRVTFTSTSDLPTIRSYPIGDPSAPQFIAAEFTITIPFRKAC